MRPAATRPRGVPRTARSGRWLPREPRGRSLKPSRPEAFPPIRRRNWPMSHGFGRVEGERFRVAFVPLERICRTPNTLAPLMPVRFHCLHCHQRLSVSSGQREEQVKCPRCQQWVRVPAAAADREANETSGRGPEGIDSFPELAWQEEAAGSERARPPSSHGIPPTVRVPRSVLYTQGFLLGAIALIFFVFGLIVGSRSQRELSVGHGSSPATVSGIISHQNQQDARTPDVGSVIILLPVATRPDEKASASELAPDAPKPVPDHAALAMIRSLGGDYARADAQGRYRVRAASTGRYFLLVISNQTRRPENEYPAANDLARLGRYFVPATELLGSHRYELKELRLWEDRHVNVTF